MVWRGEDLTLPVAKFLTFWSRKSAGGEIAAQNGVLATISEMALAARAPGKKLHRCVLLGHSFGGLVLENTISHSILDASSTGSRNTSPWDMAVAFNAADSSVGSRQLLSELEYLYRYDPARHGYMPRASGVERSNVVDQSRPFLIILQSENDMATGQFFPMVGFEANITTNHPDFSFYTSEHNNGHSDAFCHDGSYNPMQFSLRTARNFGSDGVLSTLEMHVYHAGLFGFRRKSSGAMAGCGALTRLTCWALFFAMHFPLTPSGGPAAPQTAPRRVVPSTPDVEQLKQDKIH